MILSADVLAKTGEAAKSGPIGLAVILVLCVACYFLFKSMSKHLKTVREAFPKNGGQRVETTAAPESPPAAPANPVPPAPGPADEPPAANA